MSRVNRQNQNQLFQCEASCSDGPLCKIVSNLAGLPSMSLPTAREVAEKRGTEGEMNIAVDVVRRLWGLGVG